MRRILIAIGLALALLSPVKAADSTVSAMTAASALDGTELYYTVQGGADRKATGTQLKTFIGPSIGGTIASGTAGSVLYVAAGPVLAQDNANFSWTDASQNLQVGSTSKASLIGIVTGAYDATTHGAVRITGSPGANSAFDLMTNPNGANSLPVPTFRPVVANKTIALDLSPNGTPSDAGYGLSWFDMCNTDQILHGDTATQTVHIATHAASHFLGAAQYIAGTILPFKFGTFNGDTATETTTFTINADASLTVAQPTIFSTGSITLNSDVFIGRQAAASFRLGAADAASPVAQTLGVQNVATGTSNTAGADFTIAGSKSTGSGAGGSISLQVAVAGGSGTSQNALTEVLKVDPAGTGVVRINGGSTNIGGVYGGLLSGNTGVNYHSAAVSAQYFEWNAGGVDSPDAYISRTAAASLQLGLADAAAPVAQTFGVQSVVAGTSNTAGANWTVNGSKGTGTGAGGNIILQTAPAGTTGTSQNALSQVAVVDSKSHIRVGNTTAPALTSCGGGSPTIVGTDMAGTVTMGTTATGCVITFNTAYANAPICTVTWRATPLLSQSYTTSTTAITLTQTSTSSDLVDYICFAQNAG